MNKLLYISEDEVQSQQAVKCNLLVHIGRKTFQYAVVDHFRDELKTIAEYELPEIKNTADLIRSIEALPESSRQFKYSFNKIKISVDSFHYTFIPSALYNEGDQEIYKKFISSDSDCSILTNNIRYADVKNVFAIDTELYNSLNRLFNKPRIFNQATPFAEGIKKVNSVNNSNLLFIDVDPLHVQIAVLNNNKLLFYNIFDCVNADELNYYMLSVTQELKLETTQTHAVLSGTIAEDDEFYQRVRKYFGDITFADPKPSINNSEKFAELKPYRFFSLMSLELCE